MARCWCCLVVGGQLAIVGPGPMYRPVRRHPATVSGLKVAAGKGGLGRRRRGGRVARHGVVGKGGTVGTMLEDEVVQGHVAVVLRTALHLYVHLQEKKQYLLKFENIKISKYELKLPY
jgi:hypothetical protein